MGLPRVLRERFGPFRRNHPSIGLRLIRVERRLFPVDPGERGPQFFGSRAPPIPHMKRNDLAGCGIHGDPDPVLVGLLLHKTPHLVGCGFQPSDDHVGWTLGKPHMSVIGTGGTAFHHTVQEPGEAAADRAAEPAQRDALTQQGCNHGAPRLRNAAVVGRGTQLAFTRLTLLILRPMAG